MLSKKYTVLDVINVEYNLEPLICLKCGSEEVTFEQYIGDAYCAGCGTWQLDYLNKEDKLC